MKQKQTFINTIITREIVHTSTNIVVGEILVKDDIYYNGEKKYWDYMVARKKYFCKARNINPNFFVVR